MKKTLSIALIMLMTLALMAPSSLASVSGVRVGLDGSLVISKLQMPIQQVTTTALEPT